MKKILLQFLVISLAFLTLTNIPVLANSRSNLYVDVQSNHWAYQNILSMKNLEIMNAQKDGKFYPDKAITRAEAAQYIYNALDLNTPTLTNFQYKDVPTDASYVEAVYSLVQLGVLQHSSYFYPNNYLTRAQLSKMINSAFDIEVDQYNKAKFKDISKNYWAKHDIESLADIHVLKGSGDQKFSPNGQVTRAQMAAILDRVIAFKKQLVANEIVYDYLLKDYISCKNKYPYWTEEVINLVNIERNKKSLPPLQMDAQLTKIAVIKANDMVKRNYFDHKSPFYGYPWDLAGIFDYPFVSFGENIARNYTSPKSVVNGWLNSPSHRENILSKSFTNIGVSCVLGKNGNYYWVQQFSSQ